MCIAMVVVAVGCIPASGPGGGGAGGSQAGGGAGGDQGGDGGNAGGGDNAGDGDNAADGDATAEALTIEAREDHVLGNIGAPNEIIEFGQYLCPFCRDFHTSQFAEIQALVDAGELVYTYRHFSPAGIARGLSNAAECAGDQDEAFFFELHDLIFRNQDSLSNPNTLLTEIEALAIQVDGLDTEEFLDCLTNARLDDKVGRDFDLATTLQVFSTPTFFVNGEMVEGNTPVSELMEFFVEDGGGDVGEE